MDDLIKLLFRILQMVFYFMFIDWLFGGRRRRGGGYNSNGQNKSSRYFDEETSGQNEYDQSRTNSDFYQGETQLNQAYQALGLNQSASAKEVKKRYIELAKKYHPDKNPNNVEAQAEMTKINNAYDTIMESLQKKA